MRTRRQKQRERAILCAIGVLPVIWLALRIAPYLPYGLSGLLGGFTEITAAPFAITICPSTARSLGICLFIYGLAALWIISDQRNYRFNEEYGSAKWASLREISAIIRSPHVYKNLLLTKNLRLGTDNVFQHNLALNVCLIGSPGTGKSRYFIMPNIIQMLGSYIILDPSGELLANTGDMLERHGYRIRVLNLKEPEKSDLFNPFAYVHSSLDVMNLAEILWKATTDTQAQKGEQFWDEMAKILFIALAEYLYEVAIPSEQNLPMICDLADYATINEDKPATASPLDLLFATLEKRDPDSFAVKKYREFKSAAAKTMKSVLATMRSHMGRIRVPEIEKLMVMDNMQLDRVAYEKTAIFCVTPVADTTLNFVVSMLYQVLFNTLYKQGDKKEEQTGNASLPVPVFFLMDEFANVTVPNDFQSRLATMRKYGIGCIIVLQAINQLKALYEKDWESIMALCSCVLYLGGKEHNTHKYISEELGKETVDMKNYSRTRGRMAGTSEQNQRLARDLMAPDEIAKLPKSQEIVMIQGLDPALDKKYRLESHPRYKEIAAGGAKVYVYNNLSEATCLARQEYLSKADKARSIAPSPVPFRWVQPEDAKNFSKQHKGVIKK